MTEFTVTEQTLCEELLALPRRTPIRFQNELYSSLSVLSMKLLGTPTKLSGRLAYNPQELAMPYFSEEYTKKTRSTGMIVDSTGKEYGSLRKYHNSLGSDTGVSMTTRYKRRQLGAPSNDVLSNANKTEKEINCYGVRYKNRNEFAKRLGLEVSTVYTCLSKGGTPEELYDKYTCDYQYGDVRCVNLSQIANCLDMTLSRFMSILKQQGGAESAVEYVNRLNRLSKVCGVTQDKILHTLRSDVKYTLDTMESLYLQSIYIDGILYESSTHLAELLGVSLKVFMQMIAKDLPLGYIITKYRPGACVELVPSVYRFMPTPLEKNRRGSYVSQYVHLESEDIIWVTNKQAQDLVDSTTQQYFKAFE